MRSDFNWLATAVSEHSIGPGGWIQIANFVVTGLLVLAFARGTAWEFRDGNGRPGARVLSLLSQGCEVERLRTADACGMPDHFHRILDPALKPELLLVVADREPLDQIHPGTHLDQLPLQPKQLAEVG